MPVPGLPTATGLVSGRKWASVRPGFTPAGPWAWRGSSPPSGCSVATAMWPPSLPRAAPATSCTSTYPSTDSRPRAHQPPLTSTRVPEATRTVNKPTLRVDKTIPRVTESTLRVTKIALKVNKIAQKVTKKVLRVAESILRMTKATLIGTQVGKRSFQKHGRSSIAISTAESLTANPPREIIPLIKPHPHMMRKLPKF